MFSIGNLSHIHHIGYSDVFKCGTVCVLCFGQLVFVNSQEKSIILMLDLVIAQPLHNQSWLFWYH
jgi:hypothetical protein